jgi:CubicO group peptidase (beta-lactamase class C family)
MNNYSVTSRARVVAAIFLLVLSASVQSLDLSKPEKVGMSTERLERIAQLNNRYISEGKLAGIQTMVARHGKIVHTHSAGTFGKGDDRALTKDSLFRIYSMTKPVTAVALMTLYEEGAFLLTDPVSKFLPEFANVQVWSPEGLVDTDKIITMRHLLTHTAGFSYGFRRNNPVDKLYRDEMKIPAQNLDEWVDKLSTLPLLFEPGEQWHYSVASDLLGAVAESITGLNFDEFLKQRIFNPLQMKDTFFSVPTEKEDDLVVNHRWDREENQLAALSIGQFGNPSFSNVSLFLGGQGLVSTISDYMLFAEMLRGGGELNGARILSPATVKFMTQNHLGATTTISSAGESPTVNLSAGLKGTGFGLGFGIITDSVDSGVMASSGTYYWGGAAGTIFWVDPVEDIVGIAMIQLMGSPWPFREQMMVLTYQAINELNAKAE